MQRPRRLPTPLPRSHDYCQQRSCELAMTQVAKTIVLLPGDGIGPEVIWAAARVLEDCAAEFGHQFELAEYLIGGAAIDAGLVALPNQTLDACSTADAVLL